MDFSLGTPGSPSSERSFLKQCRSISELDDGDGRLKLPRTDSSSYHQHKHGSSSDEDTQRHLDPSSYALRQYQQQQMYSRQQQAAGTHHFATAASAYCSPFTASQWAELEQQALIFKHMMARATVPQELLNPIRRSLLLSSTANGPQNMTWSGYQQGMYGSPLDIEPGRCRRTDGKKWRCSRPVVPEQKYCERHVHRGRSRSKKATAEAAAAAAAAAAQAAAAAAQSQNNSSNNGAASGFQGGSSSRSGVGGSKMFGAGVNICLGSSAADNKDHHQQQQQQRFLDHGMTSKAHFGLRPEQQLLFSELSGSTRELATSMQHQNQIQQKHHQQQQQQPSFASRLSTSSMSMAPSKSYDNHQCSSSSTSGSNTMWEHHQPAKSSPLHHFFQQHQGGGGGGGHEDQHIPSWQQQQEQQQQQDEITVLKKNDGIFSPLKLAIDEERSESPEEPVVEAEGEGNDEEDEEEENEDDEEETRIALRPPPPGGPLAEALRSSSSKVTLASPTGVLQKASCFSDCSSSASSSPGSSAKTTT